MSRFNLSGTIPFAGPHPHGPAGAFSPKGKGKGKKEVARMSGSKKGSRGTMAGFGRHAGGKAGKAIPHGPAGARFESVSLPTRASTRAAMGTAAKPSLMSRIAAKMRKAVGR